MAMDFLLVHSPLLGPTSWQPCAEFLASKGHHATVPDLRSCLTPVGQWWERASGRAAEAAADRDAVIVAGHSGAGVLLPYVAHRVRARAVAFVDAVVPVTSGASRTSGHLRGMIRELTGADGMLPRWSSWWPPGTMAELIPDDELREAVEAEQIQLPAEFYDVDVPVPDGWSRIDVAYLHLSPGYDAAAAEAADRGWKVERQEGLHLDIVRRPEAVTEMLLKAVT